MCVLSFCLKLLDMSFDFVYVLSFIIVIVMIVIVMIYYLGGGLKYFFIFIPTWGNDPI